MVWHVSRALSIVTDRDTILQSPLADWMVGLLYHYNPFCLTHPTPNILLF